VKLWTWGFASGLFSVLLVLTFSACLCIVQKAFDL
jgi:hypothetical protein